ncbi:type II toxin-antitoxin system mRNA interferase toxin, RelE/StbE family [Comamonas thiooxydans]|nr:type II toxin-antitoxin system mRNA interferase toxin, RelE/StbE family [Comamonas thiooxydans]
MTLALYWNPRAYEDRGAIMDYIAQDNPVAALELDELIEQKAEALPANPTLYRPGRVQGTREVVVTKNYVMVYRVLEARVEILRVLHARQQWPAKE